MVPLFSIRAPRFGATSKTILPAMKFSLVIPGADTTRPAAFTCAPWVKTTPDGLISTSWPLALILPAICEMSPPVTRFSAIAELEG